MVHMKNVVFIHNLWFCHLSLFLFETDYFFKKRIWNLVQIIWFITSLVAVSHHCGEIIHGQQGHSSAGDAKAKMHSWRFCLRCFEAINLILLYTVVAIEEVWANSNIRIANTASFAQDPTPPFVMFNRPSFLRTLCKPWCSTQLPSQSKLFSSIGIVTDNGEKVRRNLIEETIYFCLWCQVYLYFDLNCFGSLS